ncbi:hypothetical protein [Bartonella apis]|uniref:hypothetical protein n=1 Tax=Bartonella apis TaxID=1686310 RepID=UPI003F918E11
MVEDGFIKTNADATEFDECKTKLTTSGIAFVIPFCTFVPLRTQFNECAQCAEFCFRSGVETECCTCTPSVGITINFTTLTGINIVTTLDVCTDVTGNTHASLGSGNVEISFAIRVANAYIFNGFRLCNDNISCTSARNCNESCSGAEKKALNVHI